MSVIDRSTQILATLTRQGVPDRAIEVAGELFERLDTIRVSRYNDARTQEEMAAARADCATALQTVLDAEAARLDADCAKELEALERERVARTADRRTLADVVDVDALRHSSSVPEIRRLVQEAERAGLGQQAREVARENLQKLAQLEQSRQHLATAQSAFALYCALSRASSQGVDASSVVGRFEQQKRAIVEQVMRVAAVAKVDAQMKRAAVQATVPEPEKPEQQGKFVVGKFWRDHPEYIRR